jgi:hypothetical protein
MARFELPPEGGSHGLLLGATFRLKAEATEIVRARVASGFSRKIGAAIRLS